MTDWECMVAAMMADPENAALMCVAADMLDEMGEPAKAECLRWLGERGLTGEPCVRPRRIGHREAGYNSYADRFWIVRNGPNRPVTRRQFVSSQWWNAAVYRGDDGDVLVSRLKLIDAYAAADQGVRAEWLMETEAGLALFDGQPTQTPTEPEEDVHVHA